MISPPQSPAPVISLLLCLIALFTPIGATDDYHGGYKKKAMFSVEKSFQCHGGANMTGMSKECQGKKSMKFSVDANAMDIAHTISEGLVQDLRTDWMPDEWDLMPEDDILTEWLATGDRMDAMAPLEDDMQISHSFTYGGMASVEWGCKVTYSWKKGDWSKTADCGFKGHVGAGKKLESESDFFPLLKD